MPPSHASRHELSRRGAPRPGFRVGRKIMATFRMMHRAIVASKLRRLRAELILHRRGQAKFDVAQFPQRPLLLGDKWDF